MRHFDTFRETRLLRIVGQNRGGADSHGNISGRSLYFLDSGESEENKLMSEKAREARNAYQREYSRKNPEKMREYRRRYWERRAAREAESAAVAGEDTD